MSFVIGDEGSGSDDELEGSDFDPETISSYGDTRDGGSDWGDNSSSSEENSESGFGEEMGEWNPDPAHIESFQTSLHREDLRPASNAFRR
jgi:hypothetical protein